MKKIHSAWIGLMLFSASLSATSQETIRSINYEGVNVREKAGTAHEVLWRASKHFPFQVLSQQNGWTRVKDFEGDTGWVSSRYLSDTPTVIVKNTFANLREKPSTTAKKVGSAKYGDIFVLKEVQKEWVQVTLDDGKTAWIFRDLVWGSLGKK